MDQLISQLGGLVLGAVPTMVFFIVLLALYGALVRRPLDAVLAERRARTSGAVEQARGAMSAAEAETAVFEDKLMAARTAMFATRERRLAEIAKERDALLAEARHATGLRIDAARQEIEQGAAVARQQIEGSTGELSAKILQAILPGGYSGVEAIQ